MEKRSSSPLRTLAVSDLNEMRQLSMRVINTPNHKINPNGCTVFSDVALLHGKTLEFSAANLGGFAQISSQIVRMGDFLKRKFQEFRLGVIKDFAKFLIHA